MWAVLPVRGRCGGRSLTPPVGSEAISPSRPVAPSAPDSRLCAELLEGAAPGDVRWPLQRYQQAASPQRRGKARCRQFPVVRAAPASPRVPPPGRSRRGCGAGRRQRRAAPAAVPPAVLKWVLLPALHQPPGFGIRELKLTRSAVPPPGWQRVGGSRDFPPWKVPAEGPRILLPKWWYHVSVGGQVQGFKG